MGGKGDRERLKITEASTFCRWVHLWWTAYVLGESEGSPSMRFHKICRTAEDVLLHWSNFCLTIEGPGLQGRSRRGVREFGRAPKIAQQKEGQKTVAPRGGLVRGGEPGDWAFRVKNKSSKNRSEAGQEGEGREGRERGRLWSKLSCREKERLTPESGLKADQVWLKSLLRLTWLGWGEAAAERSPAADPE